MDVLIRILLNQPLKELSSVYWPSLSNTFIKLSLTISQASSRELEYRKAMLIA